MATLSATEILALNLEAFKVRFPMITMWTNDFSGTPARKDDIVLAHVLGLPGVEDYDSSTGFKANSDEASSLLTDVPVTLNRLKHVPVKVDYLDQLASRKDLFQAAIANQAFVLGKSVVDYVLSLVLAANFTYSKTAAAPTKQDLDSICGTLNTNGNPPTGRSGIVNTAAFNSLEADARIASRDYKGQMRGGNGYGQIQNVSGFDNIWEYPDLPTNSENLNGFFGTKNSCVIVARSILDPMAIAASLGIPSIGNFATITDPDSGLTLFAIQWQEAGTFDVYVTVGLLYGAKAGAQGGSANAITDKAGVRMITA